MAPYTEPISAPAQYLAQKSLYIWEAEGENSGNARLRWYWLNQQIYLHCTGRWSPEPRLPAQPACTHSSHAGVGKSPRCFPKAEGRWERLVCAQGGLYALPVASLFVRLQLCGGLSGVPEGLNVKREKWKLEKKKKLHFCFPARRRVF